MNSRLCSKQPISGRRRLRYYSVECRRAGYRVKERDNEKLAQNRSGRIEETSLPLLLSSSFSSSWQKDSARPASVIRTGLRKMDSSMVFSHLSYPPPPPPPTMTAKTPRQVTFCEALGGRGRREGRVRTRPEFPARGHERRERRRREGGKWPLSSRRRGSCVHKTWPDSPHRASFVSLLTGSCRQDRYLPLTSCDKVRPDCFTRRSKAGFICAFKASAPCIIAALILRLANDNWEFAFWNSNAASIPRTEVHMSKRQKYTLKEQGVEQEDGKKKVN